MKHLDIASLPLQGTHLIEASAGTGKTYTLAHLYLRLIVERELKVEEILVVTFTRAAVQELRTRLRAIIVEARAVLTSGKAADSLVAELLQPHLDLPNLAERLEEAQLSMDQAAISTIHTFCTQLLSDNAFESGQLFDMNVEEQDRDLQLQAVQEYWRRSFLAVDDDVADWVLENLKNPDELLNRITPLLAANAPTLLPACTAEQYQKANDKLAAQWHRIRQMWIDSGEDIHTLVRDDKGLSGTYVKAPTVQKAADWLSTQTKKSHIPGELPDYIRMFRHSFLQASVKKNKSAPEHEFFVAIDNIWDELGLLAAKRLSVALQTCAHFVSQHLIEAKARLRMMSYDDLLVLAAEALNGQGADEQSEALAQRLRTKFPAALIDEFQDTDPCQYGMFSRLYNGQEDLSWYMIGDPKQAIYSFRGADINTYLRAAKSTNNKHTLGTNFRSTSDMVAAVNQLFQSRKQPFAAQGEADFNPVKASGLMDSESLVLSGQSQSALRVAQLVNSDSKKQLSKAAADSQAAQIAAAMIAEQLRQGQQGTLMRGDNPLMPAHIAVLVRSNRQGKQINEALGALGIASVVTGNDSIFATAEASNLGRLLQALAEPTHERFVLRVLASDLCGYNAGQIIHLQQVDQDWQAQVNNFARFSLTLKRQGVLAALLSLMAAFSTAARLRTAIGGERSLSNYLQLGEVLQQAWQERPDIDSLQAWFERQCENTGKPGEVSQLRLETDEKLVQIVTVHKSKGLEYPVVYLPFVWSGYSSSKNTLVKCQYEQGSCIDVGSEQLEEHRERMEEENMAEELRLLYVALTRASSQVNLIWGDVSQASFTALAYLLGLNDDAFAKSKDQNRGSSHDESLPANYLEHGMQQWVASCPQATTCDVPEAQGLMVDETPVALKAASCAKPPQANWQISSYSALVRHATGHTAHRAELPEHDAVATPVAVSEPPELDVQSIMFFPRGAQAGTYLHYLFEHADFPTAEGDTLQSLVSDSLASHGYADIWQLAVTSMVQQVLDAPLYPVEGCRLRDIEQQDRLNEMGFHFPVPTLHCWELVSLLREHNVLTKNEQLDFDTVRGYMTGFIDLIFRFEGRYYVLDYKSNHLGYTAADYHPEALKQAMQEHRYDLQYLMYTVALHRYLATRIPDYHYDTHMGGSFYLFLRGIRVDDDSAPGVYFDKPPLALIEALDQLFAAETERVE